MSHPPATPQDAPSVRVLLDNLRQLAESFKECSEAYDLAQKAISSLDACLRAIDNAKLTIAVPPLA